MTDPGHSIKSVEDTECQSDPIDTLAAQIFELMSQDLRYTKDPHADESVLAFVDHAETVIPHGIELWQFFLSDPQHGEIPPPGAIAATIEEVVRDAMQDEIEYRLRRDYGW